MRKSFRKILLWLAGLFSRPIRDERTGEPVGRALILSSLFGHRLIGELRPYVRPVFLPDKRVSYWWSRIGFASWSAVDYPRLAPHKTPPKKGRIVWVILLHQSPDACESVLKNWLKIGFPENDLLAVHGGTRADFDRLEFRRKCFVSDPRLRTVNHPAQKQSYGGVLREAVAWLKSEDYDFVCLVEYDHLPLVSDWGMQLLNLRASIDADVIFHHLARVDGTISPHLRHHLSDPLFAAGPWREISIREDKAVALDAITTGSFWTRAAFEAVASTHLPCRVYLEMDLPSTAHHLGFRVKDFGAQNAFVTVCPIAADSLQKICTKGAWSAHPVKDGRDS